jgi:nicotinate-nucleotide adenylyltransferase
VPSRLAPARLAAAKTVLFGGTFDPIHNAHIEVAREVLHRFDPERIVFVPAAHPPHKSTGEQAPFDDRVRMVELACAGEPRFEVSRIEEGFARSYSILTIEKMLAAGMGPLSFLIGADAFAEIETWHRWREIVSLVDFIVVTRPGAEWKLPPGASVSELSGLWLPISSSDVRRALAAGEPDVPAPPAVLDWIRARRLYGIKSQPE